MVPERKRDGMVTGSSHMFPELYMLRTILSHVLCPEFHFKVYHQGRTRLWEPLEVQRGQPVGNKLFRRLTQTTEQPAEMSPSCRKVVRYNHYKPPKGRWVWIVILTFEFLVMWNASCSLASGKQVFSGTGGVAVSGPRTAKQCSRLSWTTSPQVMTRRLIILFLWMLNLSLDLFLASFFFLT